MPNLHPLLVHLPIALLTCSFLFDLAGVLGRKDNLTNAGWWMMLSGIVGLTSAIVTGLLAETIVTISQSATDHFQTHQQVAFLVAGVYATLFLWRIANRGEIPSRWKWGFLAVSFIGVVAIWIGAWYGGEMVYQFGVGVYSK